MKCEACGAEATCQYSCGKCMKFYDLCNSCFNKWCDEHCDHCPSCRGVENKKEEVMETKALEIVLKKVEDVVEGDEVVKNRGGSAYDVERVACAKRGKFINDKRQPEDCIILGNGFDTIMQLTPGSYVMIIKR